MGNSSTKEKKHVRSQTRRRSALSGPSVDPEAAKSWEKKVIPKEKSVRSRIQKAIDGNDLFMHLSKGEKSDLVDCMFEKTAASGETIIVQDDEGDNFYILGAGTADVFVDGNKVHSYASGDSFGELALMYGTPRAASIIATQDCTLYAIDRDTYRNMLMASVMKHRQLYETTLAKVKIVQDLDPYERSQMADALENAEYTAGEVIVKQGDIGDTFFVLMSGGCSVTVDGSEVKGLTAPDFFGEIALVTGKPRAATVTAKTAVTCARLDRTRFERVLGPCENVLRRNMQNYEKFKADTQ